MPNRDQYLAAFVREGKRGKFNVLLAVKGFPDSEDDISADDALAIGDAIICAIGKLTPRQMMNLFPPKKDFDGDRFGCKDYFYTKKAVEEYGLDRKIENAVDFLWGFQNDDIGRFMVEYLCFAGKRYRQLTGRNMAQDGMEAAHIPYRAITGDGLYLTDYDGDTRIEMPNLPAWREVGLI